MRRKIVFENSYFKDLKKVAKQGLFSDEVAFEVQKITDLLIADKPLDAKYKNHALVGDYKGYRDCHIKPDLVLIYKISDESMNLTRIGRHQDLFKRY